MSVNVNADAILATMNRHGVNYLLIGGMNFLLRHEPNVLTFDIDFWIEDTEENRSRCEAALAELDAEWGENDASWQPVKNHPPGWLSRQGVFSLHSPHGAIDIFRSVRGLADWQVSRQSAIAAQVGAGNKYFAINDEDMLKCQLALDPASQKPYRIASLQSKLGNKP
jgi:hypothetical protein